MATFQLPGNISLSIDKLRSDIFSNWFNEFHWYIVKTTWTINSEFGYKSVYLGKCSVFYEKFYLWFLFRNGC